jgi:hypothetical protein
MEIVLVLGATLPDAEETAVGRARNDGGMSASMLGSKIAPWRWGGIHSAPGRRRGSCSM